MRTVGDVIARRALHLIDHDSSARAAAERMARHQISALPVVEGQRLVGIVTERDLVQRVVAAGRDPSTTLVAEVMSKGLVSSKPEASYDAALARMKRNQVRHLLVVDGGQLVGVVSMRDLLAVDTVEKSEEIQLLTAYIHAVPPDLPPLDELDEEWRRLH